MDLESINILFIVDINKFSFSFFSFLYSISLFIKSFSEKNFWYDLKIFSIIKSKFCFDSLLYLIYIFSIVWKIITNSFLS